MPNVSVRRSRLARFWEHFAPFVASRTRSLVGLSLISSLAGFAEAAVLVLIVHVATGALSAGQPPEISAGPFTLAGVSVGTSLALAGALALLIIAARVYTSWLMACISSATASDLRKSLFARYAQASWAEQSREVAGQLQLLLTTHVDRVGQASMVLTLGLSAAFNLLALVASAMVVEPVSACAVIMCGTILFVALKPMTGITRRHSHTYSEASLAYSTAVSETVGMAMELRTFGVLSAVTDDMADRADTVERPYRITKFLQKLLPAVYQNMALVFVIIGLAVVLAIDLNDLTALGAVVLILIRSFTYTQAMQTTFHQMGEFLPFLEKVLREERRYRRAAVTTDGVAMEPIQSLAFDHISFSYHTDHPALNDVSFQVTRGAIVGVVGPSGSGKSTLVQLLLRLREPSDGQVLVNGLDASTCALDDWYRRVVLVPQESRLFRGTVADNLRFFRPVPDDVIEQAARRAHIHDDIMAWSKGYATQTGELGGNALSGGQRQRICLARALVAQPDVLVLDEPTSALDMESEALVKETLEALGTSMIIFIVAHRFSTLSVCNHLLVLNGGRLEAHGAPGDIERNNKFVQNALRLGRV